MFIRRAIGIVILVMINASITFAQLEPTPPIDVSTYQTPITTENATDFTEITLLSLFDDFMFIGPLDISDSGRYVAVSGTTFSNIQRVRDSYITMEMLLDTTLPPVEEDAQVPRRVVVWDIETGTTSRFDLFAPVGVTVPDDEYVDAEDVAISGDGSIVAASYFNEGIMYITAWDISSGEAIFTYSGDIREGIPSDLYLSEDGTQLIANMSASISVWDLTTGSRLHQFSEFPYEGSISGIDVVGSRIYYANERYIHVWDLSTGELLRTYQLPEYSDRSVDDLYQFNTDLNGIAVSEDETFAVTVSHRDGRIRVWDLTSEVWGGEWENWHEAITIYHHPDLTHSRYVVLNATEDIAIVDGNSLITAISLATGEIVAQYYQDNRLGGAGIAVNKTGSIIVAGPSQRYPSLVSIMALTED